MLELQQRNNRPLVIADQPENLDNRRVALAKRRAAPVVLSAIAKMNGSDLEGRALTVSEARPKEGAATPGGGIKRNFGPDRRAGAFQARNNRGGRR